MNEPPHIWPVRLQKFITGIASLALALAVPGAAAPTIEREVPNSVSAVSKEMLDRLPANRDFRAILQLHNRTRAGVGERPLRWNPALAANAQRYADILARTGTVEHSTRTGRENERENIIVGNPSGLNPADLAKIWINEGRLFRPGVFPNVCAGDWSTCGHFTQIIWPTTTDVGCGYARARYQALVCRYSPPGNRDGVAIGPGTSQPLADGGGRLCTTERGTVINCGNGDGGEARDGGDGATVQDDGKEQDKVCAVDVMLHRPISIDPEQTAIPEDREFDKGATTLRNDDADWRAGDDGGTGELPVITLRTDVDRPRNDLENDLVKVVASNPNALDGVFLFAFPIQVEDSRALGAPVRGVSSGRFATALELSHFTAATKGDSAADLPQPVPAAGITFWTEAKLGGTYRLVIGKLLPKVTAASVHYNRRTGQAYVLDGKDQKTAFECEDQATLTAAVVDIFQEQRSTRQTAFDVYWAARPRFRAEVWPGGGKYSWGEQYRLGAALNSMPGTPVDKEDVAAMVADAQDAKDDDKRSLDGTEVTAKGSARGGPTDKARFDGGFQMDSPRAGNVPTVNRDAANRYPHRVSLEYEVNGEKLVRPEYLELILPRVRAPVARPNPVMGGATVVRSDVNYTIADQFNRVVKAADIPDYVHLYGAGIKAWEALGGEAGRVIETGESGRPDDFNDFLFITLNGLNPIGPLGTAQRSQAHVHPNRMTDGQFTDTLVFFAPNAENARDDLWRSATNRIGGTERETRQRVAAARTEAQERSEAVKNPRSPAGRREAAADQRRITAFSLLNIPQDVILQLRVGSARHDLMVFEGNALRVHPPYFLNVASYPGAKTDGVFRFHLVFAPGRATSQLVDPNHRRPR